MVEQQENRPKASKVREKSVCFHCCFSYLDEEFGRLDAKHKSGFLVYDPNDYNTLDDVRSKINFKKKEFYTSTPFGFFIRSTLPNMKYNCASCFHNLYSEN